MMAVVILLTSVSLLANACLVSGIDFAEITKLDIEKQGLVGINDKNNDDLQIRCAVSGEQPLKITWYHNDTKIESITRFGEIGFLISEFGTLLSYSAVTHNQNGVYRCVASNAYGTVFGLITVKLHYMGSFDDGFKSGSTPLTKEVQLGQAVELKCPKHTQGSGNYYVWGYFPESALPDIWHSGEAPIKHAFVTKEGSLVYSSITKIDVDNINNNKISCSLYRNKVVISSVQIKLKATEGQPQKTKPELKTYMAPEFTVATRDEAYELLCGAIGYPYPTVTWFKDDEPISEVRSVSEGKNFTIAGGGMKLKIQPVTLQAKGVYKCQATNELGTVSKTGVMTVHSAAHFSKKMERVQSVDFFKSLTLTCHGAGLPHVEYEWYFNNSVINTTSKRYNIDNDKLTIPSADFDHVGVYLCVISNYLKVAVQPVYVKVEAIPPTVTEEMVTPTYIFKNYDNSLKCSFRSAPEPMISWSKDGKNITDVNHMEVKPGRSVGSIHGNLIIENTTDADGGQYKCVAKNLKGVDESEATVIPVVKTVITKGPQLLKLKKGGSGEMFCDAVYEQDKLAYTFQWLKDGNLVTMGTRVHPEKRITPPSQILKFNTIDLSDAGTYTCRVFTEDRNTNQIVSEDVKDAELIVIGKPSAPSGITLNGNCSDTDNITLLWKSGNKAISYYTVEFAEKNNEDTKWIIYNKEEKIVGDSVVLETAKLAPNALLKFRVKAVVMFEGKLFISDGEIIEPADCRTLPGPPISTPVVTAKTSGPNTLTLTWEEPDPILKPGPNYVMLVSYRKLPNGTVETVVVNDTNELVISNPGIDEKYEVMVQSKNDNGNGPKSKPVTVESGPGEITGAPQNVKAKVGDSNVTISWDDVQYARSYKVYYSEDNTSKQKDGRKRRDNREESVEVGADVGQAVLSDLLPNQLYSYQVSAANENGEGPRSAPSTFQTKKAAPSMPQSAVATTFADGVRIKWAPFPPSEDVSGYELTWYKTDDDSKGRQTKTLGPEELEAYITEGIEPFTFYTFELRAMNNQGKGEKAVLKNVVVSKPDKPGRPLPPTYTNVNDSTMNVVFKISDENYYGGLPDNFTIFYYPVGGDRSAAKSVSRSFPSDSNITLVGLERRPYVVYAIGHNALGASEPSGSTETVPMPTPDVVLEKNSKPFYEEEWFLILLILILLILLILIIVCCCLNKRGGKYPVGLKEKDRGGWDNQPLKDFSEIQMEDEKPPPPYENGKAPLRNDSENSLKKPFDDDMDDDNDSLDDYGEDKKLNEDIGQYGDEEEKVPPSSTALNGATMV